MNIKKFAAGVLVCCMIMGFAAGCSFGKSGKKDKDTTFTITVVDNAQLINVADTLVEKFPEYTFDIEYYAGANSSGYLNWKMENGETSDIYLATVFIDKEWQKEYLLDLSSCNDILSLYNTGSVNEVIIDGRVYLLPGPFTLGSYVYNKTLFEEKGWEVPKTHKELVALVKRIREEGDGIVPIGIHGAAQGPFLQYFGSFAQTDFLASPKGTEWQSAFFEGKAKAEEGFGEASRMLGELCDAGAFDENYGDAWQTESTKWLVNREVAILSLNGFIDSLIINAEGSTDEFSSFPYPGETEGEMAVMVTVVKYFGLNKTLGEKGNEKKLENALKIIEFLSTPEGNALFKTSDSNSLPLKNADNSELPEILEPLIEPVNNGYTVIPVYMGYERIIVQIGDLIREVMFHGKDASEICPAFDRYQREVLSKPESMFLGVADETLSHEETVQFGVNFYDSLGLADFALASDGGVHNGIRNPLGINGKVYAGNIPLDGGDRINIPSYKNFVIVSLSGQEVVDMLENGKIVTDDEGRKAVFDYYWAGIDVTIKGGKVSEVSLDGIPLDRNGVYSVLMVEDDYTQDSINGDKIRLVEDKNTTEFFDEWLRDNHITKPGNSES